MNQELISVIIPAHNVEGFLSDCLDSVMDQTYSNLEIIIIDDGSTDGTGTICDQYAMKDGRIRVEHQVNSGAATARKKGIQLSKGKYLCFVDADDRIDPSMIEYFAVNIGDCDLITSGCHIETSGGTWFQRDDLFAPGIYEIRPEPNNYFLRNFITFDDRMEDGVLPFLWNKMYKKEIAAEVIENVDLKICYAEDRDFLFQYILKCETIRITHMCLYYYRYHRGSITKSINKSFMKDLNNLYLSLEHVFRQHPANKELMHQLQLFILSRIYQIPQYFNFDWEMRFDGEKKLFRYLFPFYHLQGEFRLILYGAGTVGLDYYWQIKRKNAFDLVLWVDQNWEKYQDRFAHVVSPERIAEVEYDYVIIAISKPEIVAEIREELRAKGVPESKMLWEKPGRVYV